jgi:hypothetical protein
MRFGSRRLHRSSVSISQCTRVMHEDVLLVIPIEVHQPCVLLVVGHRDIHDMGSGRKQGFPGNAGCSCKLWSHR